MAATAVNLVDHVIPRVPGRQWVLSLPMGIRYLIAYDSKLQAAVLGVFVRVGMQRLAHKNDEDRPGLPDEDTPMTAVAAVSMHACRRCRARQRSQAA